MGRRLRAGLIGVVSLSMVGCFGAAVASPVARQGGRIEDVGVSWLWGMTTTTTRADECRIGLAEVETFVPWYAYLVSPLTLGIVTPMKKEYTCAAL